MTEHFPQTPVENTGEGASEQVPIGNSTVSRPKIEDSNEMITEGAWQGLTKGQKALILKNSKEPDVPDTLKRFPPFGY
jgi:hypothetical protein